MHCINQSYKLSFKIVYFSTGTAAGDFVVPDALMLRGRETGQYYVDRTHLKVGITGRMHYASFQLTMSFQHIYIIYL